MPVTRGWDLSFWPKSSWYWLENQVPHVQKFTDSFWAVGWADGKHCSPGALQVRTASAAGWLQSGPPAEMGRWAGEREENQTRKQAFLHESRGHKQTRLRDNSYNNLKNLGNERCHSLRNTLCRYIGCLELLKPHVHFTGWLKNFKCKDKKLTNILSFGSLKKNHTHQKVWYYKKIRISIHRRKIRREINSLPWHTYSER